MEQLPELGIGLDQFNRRYITDLLREKNAELFLSHRLEEVRDTSFLIARDGKTEALPFDYGFICLGLRPNGQQPELQRHLEEQNIPFVPIGDSKRARRMFEGIAEGRDVVETLKICGFYGELQA